jgi:hypothetical protein
MTNQVKSGDLGKVDSNKFKTIQGSNYQKPQNYSQLSGYQDVLGNFSKAAERVDNVQDYGTQQSVLRDEFSKNYQGYNSGMGTLDTFLLRADKDAAAKTKAWQQANQDYGSIKNPDGTKPVGAVSKRFNSDVTGVLDSFFTGQEGAFNSAKSDMNQAVGQRRSALESSVTPEMIAARKAEIDAQNLAAAEQMRQESLKAGVVKDPDFYSKYGSSSGTLDAADLMSDADFNALSILEGLDGGRSSLQDQARGDYSVSFDADAARQFIRDNTPPPPAPKNPEVKIGTPEATWSNPTSAPWKGAEKPVEKAKDSITQQAKDKWVDVRDGVRGSLLKVGRPIVAARKWL